MFEDVVITREFKSNIDTFYKKIAVFLNTDKALLDFNSTYDLSLTMKEAPIKNGLFVHIEKTIDMINL